MPNPKIDKRLLSRIRRIIIEVGSPIIPISLIFQELGYSGANGVLWGILVGVVGAVSIELGYELTKLGSILVLTKKEKETEPQKINMKEEQKQVGNTERIN